MANGSCLLPHWECLPAQGTILWHMLCPTGSVLEQWVLFSYYPERTGKQWDEGENKWSEGKELRGKPLLLSRKVIGWDKAQGIMYYSACFEPTGSMLGNSLAKPQDSLWTPKVLSILSPNQKWTRKWEDSRENHQTFSVCSTDGDRLGPAGKLSGIQPNPLFGPLPDPLLTGLGKGQGMDGDFFLRRCSSPISPHN